MPIAGDRPPRLGGDVVTVEYMREDFVAYPEYEQQMCMPNGDGCGPVLARSPELVDSTTPMMVMRSTMAIAGWTSPRRSYCKGSDSLLALVRSRRVIRNFLSDNPSAEDGCNLVGRQQGINAKEFPAEIEKDLAYSGLTEVVEPDGRQYMLKLDRVLVGSISAGIEPFQVRRNVERKMRFFLVAHEPGALLRVIAKQRQDQAVLEKSDAAHR